MRRAWTVLSGFGLAGFLLWSSAVPASADPTIGFDASTPIAVSASDPGTAAIVNDTSTPYQLTAASAMLFSGGPAVSVAIATSGSFAPLTQPVPVSPGAVVQLQVKAGSGAASTGFLTVTLTNGHSVVYLHRSVSFSAASVVAATTSVTQLSRAGLFHALGGGNVTVAVPLTSGTCGAVGTPSVTVVDHDRVVTGHTRCSSPSAGAVEVRFHLPGAGTYKGSISLGGKDIAIELDRGSGPAWPILAILIGLVLAIIVQALTEADWIRTQRGWLDRQPRQAEVAGDEFAKRTAKSSPWLGYALASYVEDRAKALGGRITAVVNSRGAWAKRWLVPWPTGFQAKERAAILAEIIALDGLIDGWPAAADAFAKANTLATGADRPIIELSAPDLLATVEALLTPAAKADLPTVRTEIGDAVAAMQLAKDINGQLDRLSALTAVESGLSQSDQALLGTAWQQHRTATEALKQCQQPSIAVSQVAPLVAAAAHSIAGLPDPASVVTPVTEAFDGGATPDRAYGASSPVTALGFRVLVPLQAASRFVQDHVGIVSFWLVLLVNLVAGVWSGLAVLYVNKPWGHPLDFVVAIAWGFAASTVLAPVVGLLRTLGTRAADAAKPAS